MKTFQVWLEHQYDISKAIREFNVAKHNQQIMQMIRGNSPAMVVADALEEMGLMNAANKLRTDARDFNTSVRQIWNPLQ